MKRRSYLTMASASIGLLVGGLNANVRPVGATDSTGEPSEDLKNQFDSVVDVVDAGGDPNGEEPITPVLERNARSDNTLVYFPPGEYRMDRRFRHTGFTNYGIIGNDAVIVPESYEDFNDLGRNAHMLFMLGTASDPGRGLLFQNLTIDQTAKGTGARVIQTEVEDGLRVRHINIKGFHDTGSHGPGLFHITNENGYGLVREFKAPDGGAYANNAPGNIGNFHLGPTGIMMGKAHKGTLWFRDCELGGFPDNGLYDSVGPGRCIIDGGVFRNSNVASIRLGGKDSEVRDVKIIVDESRPEDSNQRGIRMDHGDDLAIRNTDIYLESPTGHAITASGRSPAGPQTLSIEGSSITIEGEGGAGIVLYGGSGETEIRDVDIQMSVARQALVIQPHDIETPGRVLVHNVSISGGADGSRGREAIVCRRDGTEFRNLDLHQTGGAYRQGLGIRADDVIVANSELRTNYWPITVVGSSARIVDTAAVSTAGRAAVRLYEGHDDIRIISSDLRNGIRDDGGTDLVEYES